MSNPHPCPPIRPQEYAARVAAIVDHQPGSAIVGKVPPVRRNGPLAGATIVRRPSGRLIAVLSRTIYNRRNLGGGPVCHPLVVDVGPGILEVAT